MSVHPHHLDEGAADPRDLGEIVDAGIIAVRFPPVEDRLGSLVAHLRDRLDLVEGGLVQIDLPAGGLVLQVTLVVGGVLSGIGGGHFHFPSESEAFLLAS